MKERERERDTHRSGEVHDRDGRAREEVVEDALRAGEGGRVVREEGEEVGERGVRERGDAVRGSSGRGGRKGVSAWVGRGVVSGGTHDSRRAA